MKTSASVPSAAPLRRRQFAAFAAVVLAFAPSLAFADGSVAGTLKHAVHGTPLQGAAVRLTPGDREAVTDRSGAYYFGQVPAGSYTVEVSYLGLEAKSVSVRVVDGQLARVDTQLGGGDAIVMQAFTVESAREG